MALAATWAHAISLHLPIKFREPWNSWLIKEYVVFLFSYCCSVARENKLAKCYIKITVDFFRLFIVTWRPAMYSSTTNASAKLLISDSHATSWEITFTSGSRKVVCQYAGWHPKASTTTFSHPRQMFGVLVKNICFSSFEFLHYAEIHYYFFKCPYFLDRRPSLGNRHIGINSLPGHGSWRSKKKKSNYFNQFS
jgi:hypothetical protein